MSSRVIFYYQTFTGLKPILTSKPNVTHIHLSSLHFCTGKDGKPYIHLNDMCPDDPKFKEVWADLEKAYDLGIKIVVMIGGAGGGYASLFEDYEAAYCLLQKFLSHRIITGIDLDIEEMVALDDVRRLIRDVKRDYPRFTIAMAPIQSSLQTDEPGMGGFVYKDLLRTAEGKQIDYFNGQFYSDFSEEAYDQVIKNGYPPNKVVMGSMNGSGSVTTVSSLAKKYKEFGGVFSWEYSDTSPSPADWAKTMSAVMDNSVMNSLMWFPWLCML